MLADLNDAAKDDVLSATAPGATMLQRTKAFLRRSIGDTSGTRRAVDDSPRSKIVLVVDIVGVHVFNLATRYIIENYDYPLPKL
jgi:hypothetical protein